MAAVADPMAVSGTATITNQGLGERLAAVDVSSRTARHAAMQVADAALAQGDVAFADGVCRRVLLADRENTPALAMFVCIATRAGRHTEALAAVSAILDHFRSLHESNTLPHALLLLERQGFTPRGILDVGAYHGEFSVFARQVFRDTAVLMVEPQPKKREFLDALAQQLGGDVAVRCCLCGDHARPAVVFHQLATPFGSTGSSIYPEMSDFPREVLSLPMRTVDELVAELPGRRFDLMKVDVQGAELDVLRGARTTLAQVEVLVIELSLHSVNRGSPLLAEVVDELDALGFAMFDLQTLPRTDGLLLQVDALFVRKGSALWPNR